MAKCTIYGIKWATFERFIQMGVKTQPVRIEITGTILAQDELTITMSYVDPETNKIEIITLEK